MKKMIIVVILGSFFLQVLQAEDIELTESIIEQPSPQRIFKLGAGFLTLQKPYKGVDQECYGIPFVFYQDEKLTIFGPTGSYSFFGEENQWAFQGTARFRTEGFDDDDSRYLHGMSDRDPTLELGLRYITDLDFAVISLDFSHDVLDEHRGYEFRMTLRKSFRDVMNIESLTLTPSAGVNWRSKQLNDYYYGVRPAETVPGRPAYDVGGCVNWLTGLQVDYKLSEKWTLLGLVNVEWLDSEITDSPIVDDDYSVSFLLGAMYEF